MNVIAKFNDMCFTIIYLTSRLAVHNKEPLNVREMKIMKINLLSHLFFYREFDESFFSQNLS